MQQDFELLYEDWERYKELIHRYPHHGFPMWFQVQTFYNGLSGHLRTTIDAITRGALMARIDGVYDFLGERAANNYPLLVVQPMHKRVAGIHDVDVFWAGVDSRITLTPTLTTLGGGAIQTSLRAQRTLPSDTEVNPRREGKEKVTAITLKCEKKVENSVRQANLQDKPVENEIVSETVDKQIQEKEAKATPPPPPFP
ncbi:Uncharacterized protein TCM_008347 [Theobroma cacao]|uniref:Uncharacterized protein n=1 Tax=Theobroma cacao TaxID=3641 RepID=A0A061E5L4_THECC|nr:Uncharacterized protein TCM_008347 [Theobroma cacao]